ncbi:MAG TPA: YpdA family putative bacillithiol disulfide reductase [Thermoanaerobaculia bacterium]|jgi:thioredoxin reductase (NADPH)|nr:YpdA family putative bacillithiol disulfide reductase [Thermoanaerobaculia bacterium]
MTDTLDLLVVGAGPTGIAIGAEARREGLSTLLVDRGPLTAAIQGYPTFMEFFTTRDRLEIAHVPFTIPDAKPTRQQALVYYRFVVEHYQIPVALYEEVLDVRKEGEEFVVRTRRMTGERTFRARSVAIATGYFINPRKLGVSGEDLPWVFHHYKEPYPHYGQDVVVIGAGNTAAEAALDLWRSGGVRVTLVHRGPHLKPGVKYWLKPDVENRIEEGSIAARFNTRVRAFLPEGAIELETPTGPEVIPAQAAYVLIGYTPDADFERRCGIELDPETLIPTHDPETCESNVPGLYVAGTLQAGRWTDRIFIENSRDHGPKIVAHLKARLARTPAVSAVR